MDGSKDVDEDRTFRLILISGFLLMASVGAFHRIKSQSTGEQLDRRQEGLFILISLRLSGLLVMIGFLSYMIHPVWLAWSFVPIPLWARWVGVGIGAMFLSLMTWVFRSLGKNITDTVVTRADHTLITSGPYRWVRHPFYGAAALGMVSVALITTSWYFVLTAGCAIALLVIRTRIEEDKLIERFGDDYRAYMQKTGRFFPRLKS